MADVDSSLLWLCQQVAKKEQVILSGECSDEIFGGYPWFYRDELKDLDTFPWLRSTKAVSYTHLDVYKRQALQCRRRAGGWLFPGGSKRLFQRRSTGRNFSPPPKTMGQMCIRDSI